jgi:sugar phosphate isomerase/epimerase
MAFPGPGNTDSVLRSEADGDFLMQSLGALLDDDYFGGIEITHIKNSDHRARVAELLRETGSDGLGVAFLCQPVQLVNEEDLIDPSDISSPDENERVRAVDRILGLLTEASGLGASSFELLSGRDPGYSIADPSVAAEARENGRRALVRSLDAICAAASELEIHVLLEIFDNLVEEGGPSCFKGQLVGPASSAIAIAESVRYDRRRENFGLLYDSSHMAMMGETPETLNVLKPYLDHVHIANCVVNPDTEQSSFRRGDMHPKFGAPGSAVDGELLTGFVRGLVEIDYTGPIGFEVRPIGSERPLGVIAGAKTLFEEARRSISVAYARSSGYAFRTREFLPERVLERMTELRVRNPSMIAELLASRNRRSSLTGDASGAGLLTVLAADHPARNVTAVGDDPTAMGNRLEYLGRIMRVLSGSEVDGLMATSDVIEDVVLADHVLQEAGGESVLADRLLIGSMNRTGLMGAEHEMLDKASSYRSAKRIVEAHLDGAKLLLRFSLPDKHDRYVLQTMDWCAEAIEECNDLDVPVFLEPLAVSRTADGYAVVMEADPLIKVIGIAQALSHSTARTWLKIPYTEGFDRVAKATSLPILLLGGAATGRPWETVEDFVRGMGMGPNVRGALVGRNVLYPGDEDPAVIAQAIHLVVHKRMSAIDAMVEARGRRGDNMNAFGQ